MFFNPFSLPRLYRQSKGSLTYALDKGLIGGEFGVFGRDIGRRLLLRGYPRGLSYLLVPVNIIRYFEFSFALSCLPKSPGRCLDVSSPRLFSLYIARYFPSASVSIINPDRTDIFQTATIVSRLGLKNVRTKRCGVDMLTGSAEKYECLWSISVVEHISGKIDDGRAVKLMYDSLSPGGTLILTVPVDRNYRAEYREEDHYGTSGHNREKDKYFFAHVYDKKALEERLLSPIGKQPAGIRWFGEASPGLFSEYEKRWTRDGLECIIDDPREIVDHYREYPSWDAMPGEGVCGLAIRKDG